MRPRGWKGLTIRRKIFSLIGACVLISYFKILAMLIVILQDLGTAAAVLVAQGSKSVFHPHASPGSADPGCSGVAFTAVCVYQLGWYRSCYWWPQSGL